MKDEEKKPNGLIEKLHKVYSKEDVSYIIITPFLITLIFGEDFKNIIGEDYELLRYLVLILIAVLSITYIKLSIVVNESKDLKEVIDNTKSLDNYYAETLKLYKDNLEISEQLRNAYTEESNNLKHRVEALEKEVKEKKVCE
jgi:hypothetical protein